MNPRLIQSFLFAALWTLTSIASGAEAPLAQKVNVLMTPYEISNLRDIDRTRYLTEVQNLLGQASSKFLLAADNQCGESRQQCEPSIFGEDACIPKHADPTSQCPQQAHLEKAAQPFLWEGFAQRIQTFCTDQKMPKVCRELEEKRVQIFMSRRTH